MVVALVVREVPTVKQMIAELLHSGTIMGHATLARVREAKVGLALFAQDESIDPDERLRKLGGISLAMGITFEQLTQQKHDELVMDLQRRVTRHPAVALRVLEGSTLLSEIRNWTS